PGMYGEADLRDRELQRSSDAHAGVVRHSNHHHGGYLALYLEARIVERLPATRWLILAALLAVSGAALVSAQRRRGMPHVRPEAMLSALADTEREWSRIPARFTRLSDRDEVRIGDAMAENYLAHASLSDEDHAIEAYLASVGNAVARQARRKLDYRFHYIPSPGLVNAFALPGGHVFLGKGLL